jgi:phospho-N-acetylmuramoyl-pentapeptide-transferase
MGGIVFIFATVLAYAIAQLVVMGKAGRGVTATGVVLLGVFVAMGLVGFLDDFIKVRRRRSLGLNKRGKILGQLAVGVGFGILALQVPSRKGETVGSTAISFVRDVDWLQISKVGAVILFTFVVIAAANAVNLTDGLDGLATGSSVMVLIAFSLIGYWQFRHGSLYDVRDPLEVALVAAAAAGACFGFLWWNAFPAKIFMGDTGALGLGGLIAGLAVATKTILLLPIMGILFVIITASVIIQIISFRTTGRRVFRMAPLQHHFELAGWGEVTIVIRFWIIAAIGVASALGIFYSDFLGKHQL